MNAPFRCVVALALGVFPGLGRAGFGGSGVTLIDVYPFPPRIRPNGRRQDVRCFAFTYPLAS